nr:recombinase family protein [Bradyrhizobium sp. LCT2]
MAGVANHHGRPWTENIIRNILANENYVGNLVYNRTSSRLGQRLTKNSCDLWVRGDPHLDAIVDQGIFVRAQDLLAQRYISMPEEKMLTLLRVTLSRKGKLTGSIINNTPGMPSAASYFNHFGSLRKAYSLIGYKGSRDCDWFDCRDAWANVVARHKLEAVEALRGERGLRVTEVETGIGLTVNRKLHLSFAVVRYATKGTGCIPCWRVYLKLIPAGLVAVARLDGENKTIQDYVLLPVPQDAPAYLWLSDRSLVRQKATRFATFDELICKFVRGLPPSSHPKPTRPARPSKRARTIGPKPRNVHARRR